MKTLVGHFAGQDLSSLGRATRRFYRALEAGPHHFPLPHKTTAPFTPLRQPLGGHGNFRKEHRAA